MEIYKNDYSKEEDPILWELHEIRHKLNQEFKKKDISEINREALSKFADWKKERYFSKKSE